MVADAADVLLHDWPQPYSSTRRHALAACLAVLRNEKPPRVAREAFVEAAKDARILLTDQPQSTRYRLFVSKPPGWPAYGLLRSRAGRSRIRGSAAVPASEDDW
ncbi:DUF982 domain-containing protein [Mesorhizobium sp.]|uniref:DUF982 domain-containing protein n=1 Tax=Mesorhizobium sp. TaxID=1871066 RepID=UPI0025BC468E|nr:DUF982 domain-containing protein [Mesorhizobium sp.]